MTEDKKIDKATALLLKKYEEGKNKNSRWSQRAFANRLGVSSGALSEILQGKRVLSSQIKKKIAPKLQLSPLEHADFFDDELPQHLKASRLEYYRLSSDQFHLISDWWHYGILNLIKTKDFKPSVLWMAERLNISVKVLQESWERLFRTGHLVKEGKKVRRQFPRLESSDGLINLSVQKSHIEDTKLIENSLLNIPVELRDHTSMTFAMNKKDLPRARELIRSFQDRFSEEIEAPHGQAEEVYKISVSLFPLTNIRNKKEVQK